MNTPARHSEIYDLGYRNYDGPRLGRRYAARSLGALSLRNTFGFGRGVTPKIIAFALTLFALVPALIQLAIGAIIPSDEIDFEFVRPHEYYGFVQTILVLFVASMASELVGNDRKNNTLPLYFSRPIERSDYVLAKVGALTLGLQMLTLVPQLLMFVGNWLGATDGSGWFSDNASDLPAILVSAILVSAQLASLSIVVATFATKRAFAMVAILALFLMSLAATAALADLLPAAAGRIVMMFSPIYVTRAVSLVLFDAVPAVRDMSTASGPDEQIGAADLPGVVWIAVCVGHIALAVWFAIRRYRDTI